MRSGACSTAGPTTTSPRWPALSIAFATTSRELQKATRGSPDEPPPDPRSHVRAAARHVRGDPLEHGRVDLAAADRLRPGRHPGLLHLGRHLDAARADDQYPDLGEAVRPVRPQAAGPDRAEHLRPGL